MWTSSETAMQNCLLRLFLESFHYFFLTLVIFSTQLDGQEVHSYQRNNGTISHKISCGSMVYPIRVYTVLIATFVILRRKWELRGKIFRTMRVQNTKMEKRGAILLTFCNDHLQMHCIYLANTFRNYFRLKLSTISGCCPQWLVFSKICFTKSCKDAMNTWGGQIMGALLNVFFNDYNGLEDRFLIDGKLVQGKLLKKVNPRHLKWPTEKWAFTKIKPRMGRKNIPTQENDKTISPKIFLTKYGIPEKGIHCVNCNFS